MQRYEVSDERPNFFAKRIERIKKNYVFRIEKMTETKYKSSGNGTWTELKINMNWTKNKHGLNQNGT